MTPHGLMFHHFHAAGFPPSQGSIDAQALAMILDHYKSSRNLLDAAEYLQKSSSDRLQPDDVCLTFDDSLLCQYQVALPVLEDFGVSAFWFVYSSVVDGGLEMLEVFRRFRSEYFDDIDAFYAAFFDEVQRSSHHKEVEQALHNYSPATYLAEFPFYSDNDKQFRYVRDKALGKAAYDEVTLAMITTAGTSVQTLAQGLWMNAPQLRELHGKGHIIGLHSHTHPTALADLPPSEQRREYVQNRQILSDILGAVPTTMSHPCNSYSPDTLEVLASMGVELGFCSNMSKGVISRYEHPREDHANIVKDLGL